MKNILNVYKWKAIKRGFFGGEKLQGEFLLFSYEHKNALFFFQFTQHYKNDLYVIVLAEAFESPDHDVMEEFYEQLEYSADIDILEKNIKIKVADTSGGIKLTLAKPSKYLGKTIEIMNDSRLGRGSYMAKVKMKKGFEPAVEYKRGDLGFSAKMRAYSSARLPKVKGKSISQI